VFETGGAGSVARTRGLLQVREPFVDMSILTKRARSSGFHKCTSEARRPAAGANNLPAVGIREQGGGAGAFARLIEEIFEEQLDDWYRIAPAWPTERGLAEFHRWFECSFHSMIIELGEEPIEHEEA
jgi:hypothetical protein